MTSLQARVRGLAEAAKVAGQSLGTTLEEERNHALALMATRLRERVGEIVAANAEDMQAARQTGTSESLLDRLFLDEGRIMAMACALEELVALPDPLGRVLEHRVLENGLELERVSVPLGLVAVVYEARPNVTADAAGICLKSGNACLLRGGSLAAHSNACIARLLHDAAVEAGMPRHCVTAITDTDRAATDELMELHGIVDVLVPRGGAGLIRHCVEHSKVPVIETGTGNCHVYVDKAADQNKALAIVINAKCRRFGVCNAAETLLVDRSIVEEFLPRALRELSEYGVTIHGDETTCDCAARCGIEAIAATEADWETEYLAPDIAVCCVDGVDAAISHINRYGTHHSEAIVTEDELTGEHFLREVDAAAVYVNASTAFTDGGQFGLGAEIGISTQKLHARGPFALEALTSYKYLIRGCGQVRP